MEDLLIEVLHSFGYPVIQQGSMLPDEEYPETFFTFWNNDSSDSSYYDNGPHCIIWDYDVNIYSSDPATVYDTLRKAKEKLKVHGFNCPDNGYTIGSDQKTHIGRGTHVLFVQQI